MKISILHFMYSWAISASSWWDLLGSSTAFLLSLFLPLCTWSCHESRWSSTKDSTDKVTIKEDNTSKKQRSWFAITLVDFALVVGGGGSLVVKVDAVAQDSRGANSSSDTEIQIARHGDGGDDRVLQHSTIPRGDAFQEKSEHRACACIHREKTRN